MAKSMFGGMTDYSHQSFDDILSDLKEELRQTIGFRDYINTNIEHLESSSYWPKKINIDFVNSVRYALHFYNTTISEFQSLLKEMPIEVKKYHVKQLENIGRVAREINFDMGKVWHQLYLKKDYGEDYFLHVENLYADTRDLAVRLQDMSNIADRLNDFIGKTSINMKKNNPWISGSFYLVSAIVLLSLLAGIVNVIPLWTFPIIILGGLIILVIIGLLQLKNDDRISDKSFTSLIKETFKQLPLLNKTKNEE